MVSIDSKPQQFEVKPVVSKLIICIAVYRKLQELNSQLQIQLKVACAALKLPAWRPVLPWYHTVAVCWPGGILSISGDILQTPLANND